MKTPIKFHILYKCSSYNLEGLCTLVSYTHIWDYWIWVVNSDKLCELAAKK